MKRGALALVASFVACVAATEAPAPRSSLAGEPRKPTPSDDSVSAVMDRPSFYYPTMNDVDPDGSALAIVRVSQGAHGSVSVIGSGAFVGYTPAAGFTGKDAFTYTVRNARGLEASAKVSVSVGPSLVRRSTDSPDDSSEHQVLYMYVLPSDGADEQLDTNGTLSLSIAAMNAWFAGETGGSLLRPDTRSGELDLVFVRLSQTDAQIASRGVYVRDEIESALVAKGFNDAHKIYAVFYGGSSTFSCGGGPWPPTLVGHVAAEYLNGAPPNAPPCHSNPFAASVASPGYLEFALVHEILHSLGIVARGAPHHTREGHSSDDPRDLMYAGDEPWHPSILDLNHDDYYRHGKPGVVDLAKSVFLHPRVADAVKPPGW